MRAGAVLGTVLRTTAAVVGLLVACVGVLVMSPPAVVLVAFLSTIIGLGAPTVLVSAAPGRPPPSVPVCVAVTGAALAVVTGSVAILGVAAVMVLPLPAAVCAAAAWRRLRAPGIPAPRRVVRVSRRVGSDSVADLRSAWERSCALLRHLPPGPARWELADERRLLLDELELHDPAGFDQWLRTAVGDPPPGRA
jgi:hypothetical protein